MTSKRRLALRDSVLFAMLAAMMFASRQVMAALPNIHLLGMFVALLTVVYRVRALIPLYLYVLMEGIFYGFSVWWIPYLYIWTVLWGAVMLLPRNMPDRIAAFVYPAVCACHGILYGTLYAPAQALIFGYTLKQTIAWIISGLGFDAIHAISNLASGTLVLPLSKLLFRLERKY